MGRFVSMGAQNDVFSFLRKHGDTTLLVMLNFDSGSKVATAPLDGELEVVLSSNLERAGERCSGTIDLAPFEALLLRPAAGRG
jgi:hypothetical protein